ncbi:MAG: hypothetical protein IIZ46_01140 [Clostridia bacterium]|nr:hypothetical protein [Clostridia bacterium]
MTDRYTEQLEKRQNTPKDTIQTVLSLIGVFTVPFIFIILGVFVNFYFIVVAVCAFFFAVYGSYYILNGLYVEYEYTVTNSNITVDKVIGKSRRKMIMSVDIRKFNSLAKLKNADIESKKYEKIFRASITPDGDDVFAAEMHLDKFGGDCLLLFSPNEKTLESMLPYLKNTIRISLRNSGIHIKSTAVQTDDTFQPQKTQPPVTNKAKSENKSVESGKNNTESKKTDTKQETDNKAESKKTDTKQETGNKIESKKTDTKQETDNMTDKSGNSKQGQKKKGKKKK